MPLAIVRVVVAEAEPVVSVAVVREVEPVDVQARLQEVR